MLTVSGRHACFAGWHKMHNASTAQMLDLSGPLPGP